MQYSLRTIALGGLLAMGLAAGNAYAQDSSSQPTPAPAQGKHAMHAANPDQQLKHLTKALKLSADQQNQIKPILTDEDQQIQSLRADTSIAPKDKRPKMQSIRQDASTKLEAVLNDQQKQQFEQLMAAQQAKHHPKKSADSTAQPDTH